MTVMLIVLLLKSIKDDDTCLGHWYKPQTPYMSVIFPQASPAASPAHNLLHHTPHVQVYRQPPSHHNKTKTNMKILFLMIKN